MSDEKAIITRLDFWKNDEGIDLFIDTSNNEKLADFLSSINYKNDLMSSYNALVSNAKELIYNEVGGVPELHVISQSLCPDTFKLLSNSILKFIFDGSDKEGTFKDIKNIIAYALAIDVPVYPNVPEYENILLEYYKSIIESGFTAPGEKGEEVKLRATNSKKIDDFKIENLNNIDTTRYWSALDLLLLKHNLQAEFLKLGNAQRTLSYLQIGIAKLEDALSTESRNENILQSILTKNPILFGLDYARIIPKHQLGSEYEVDYALEKYSGLIDIVEIESGNLKLFTKRGNPSKDMVHAEQQIIDWLNWIEKNNAYANSKISGFISPKGFVVIGRSNTLTKRDSDSLIRRNILFNDKISIMTYDDLLAKAKTTLAVLSGMI